jgi:serine/threonine protein kinase
VCNCDRDSAALVSPVSDYGRQKPEETVLPKDETEMDLDGESFPLDRYKPLNEIGRGASGVVYLCRDRLLGKKVAVKCLHSINATQLVDFQNEARATSQLKHPGVVGVLDFGSTRGGAPFMVLEYVNGISLGQYIEQNGPLNVLACAKIFNEVGAALSHAHEKGIFHRDLKSSNIVLFDDGSIFPAARLIDFGVAGVKHVNQEPTIVQGRTLVGTPLYMPPDQANGLPYTAQSEVYALGCVLFEALTGKPPFEGVTALETIAMHARTPAPSLAERRPDLSFTDEIENVVADCLAKDPQSRFASMAQFSSAIAQTVDRKETETEAAESTTGSVAKSSFLLPVVIGLGLTFFAIAWFSIFLETKGDKTEKAPEQSRQKSSPVDQQSLGEVIADENSGIFDLEQKTRYEIRSMIEDGHMKEALAAARKLVKANPDAAMSVELLGATQQLNNDAAGALKTLTALVKNHPELPSGHFHRGAVLTELGRDKEAEREYAEAVNQEFEPVDFVRIRFKTALEALRRVEFKINNPHTAGMIAVSDDDIKQFVKSGGKALEVFGKDFTSAGLAALNNSKVEELAFTDFMLAEKDFAVINNLGRLEKLRFRKTPNSFTTNVLKYFSHCSELRLLDFQGMRVADESFKYLSGLKKLSMIKIKNGTGFSGEGWKYLQNPSNIDIEWIGHDAAKPIYSESAIVQLSKIPHLEKLTLSWDEMEPSHFRDLWLLKTVTVLNLKSPVGMAPSDMAGVAKMPSLSVLCILGDDSVVSYNGSLSVLKNCSGLSGLTLRRTEITDREFVKTVPTHLKSLTLQEPSLTRACLPTIARMRGLTSLMLVSSSITQKDVNALKRSLPKCSIEFVTASGSME